MERRRSSATLRAQERRGRDVPPVPVLCCNLRYPAEAEQPAKHCPAKPAGLVRTRMHTSPSAQSPVVSQPAKEPKPQMQAFTPPPFAARAKEPGQLGTARKQSPSRHAPPAAQATPHAPQLASSDMVSMQPPPQDACPGGHGGAVVVVVVVTQPATESPTSPRGQTVVPGEQVPGGRQRELPFG